MPFQKGHKFGHHGKQPNAGCKPLKIRALCAKRFNEQIPMIVGIAKDKSNEPRDRLAAAALLARYGVGERFELAGDPDAPLKVKLDVL
jgi:hypothetical protein